MKDSESEYIWLSSTKMISSLPSTVCLNLCEGSIMISLTAQAPKTSCRVSPLEASPAKWRLWEGEWSVTYVFVNKKASDTIEPRSCEILLTTNSAGLKKKKNYNGSKREKKKQQNCDSIFYAGCALHHASSKPSM